VTNRLEAVVAALAARGAIGVAPYVTAGDGGLARTLAVLHGLEQAGAACVELGVPFSDPIADGPLLQAAAQRALEAGTTLDGVLDVVRAYRAEGGRLPLLAFSYLNPLLRGGLARTAARLAEAGLDGTLVPDLPVEEADELRAASAAHGLAPVFFATPTTSDARIAAASRASRGFLYVIGRTGITGAATALGGDALAFLARARAHADKPLGVGFGIRSAEQIAALRGHASLAIVGTALVQHIHDAAQGAADPLAAARAAAMSFVRDLAQGAPA
jgi:tryptophan synthase alpha chain